MTNHKQSKTYFETSPTSLHDSCVTLLTPLHYIITNHLKNYKDVGMEIHYKSSQINIIILVAVCCKQYAIKRNSKICNGMEIRFKICRNTVDRPPGGSLLEAAHAMVCGLQSPILASQLQPPIFITIIIIIIALIVITVTIIIIIINLTNGGQSPNTVVVTGCLIQNQSIFGHFLSKEILVIFCLMKLPFMPGGPFCKNQKCGRCGWRAMRAELK